MTIGMNEMEIAWYNKAILDVQKLIVEKGKISTSKKEIHLLQSLIFDIVKLYLPLREEIKSE